MAVPAITEVTENSEISVDLSKESARMGISMPVKVNKLSTSSQVKTDSSMADSSNDSDGGEDDDEEEEEEEDDMDEESKHNDSV